jgi:hypothetical protein
MIEEDEIKTSNAMIYRFVNRHNDNKKLVEWGIDMYINGKNSLISYNKSWDKLMFVISEIEKEENIDMVTVSGKGTVIRFKNKSKEDIFVKVNNRTTNKIEACWKTIIQYLKTNERDYNTRLA